MARVLIGIRPFGWDILGEDEHFIRAFSSLACDLGSMLSGSGIWSLASGYLHSHEPLLHRMQLGFRSSHLASAFFENRNRLVTLILRSRQVKQP